MFICDTHNDALLHLERPMQPLNDENRHISIEKMKQGQVSLLTFAAFTCRRSGGVSPLHWALREINGFYDLMEVHKDELMQAKRPEDVISAVENGKMAGLLSTEGGDSLEGDANILRLYHKLGVRMFGVTWSNDNELASCCMAKEDRGLTDFGRECIDLSNELHMMIDLSHSSDKTFFETVERSKQPVLCSHSCARALAPDQPRDMTDEMLDVLGKSGGYVGVNLCPIFLLGGEEIKKRKATLDDVVDHLERMGEFAGMDHIGIGSDFDGIENTPEGLEDVSCLPNLYNALLKRNWKEEDARAVMGENFLSYWTRVLEG